MNKKDSFILEIDNAINSGKLVFSNDAQLYFEAFKGGSIAEKPAFTENGKLILQYMKDNMEVYNNMFKSKDVAEGMGLTSRTVSGASRKLVTDGYLEKLGEKPVTYSLTDKGIEINLDAE